MNPTTSAGGLPSFGSVASTTPSFNFGTSTTTTVPSFGNFGIGTSATPSLSFGVTTSTAAPPNFNLGTGSATSGTTFGTSTGFGGLSQLAVKPTTTTTGFSFGQQAPAAAATVTSSSAPSFAGLSTGFSVPSTAAATTAGFSLGLTTTAPATATSFSLPTTSTPQTGFSLGTSIPAATTTTAPATGFSLATTAAASTGFSLNLGTTTATATSAPSLSLGSTLGSAPPATTASTEIAPTPAKSQVNFSQLDETIHKWTLELVELERVFLNQMDQVRDWDRLLLSTGDKIVSLNDSMQKVKLRQQQLNHELDFIVAQQRELEECLVPLEKEFADVTISDPERNSIYQSAENLNTQLQQISEDLKGVIEHINEKNKSQDTNDPIAQISRILNAHMNSLQWVDQNTVVIQQMLDQVGKMRDIYRRDTDAT